MSEAQKFSVWVVPEGEAGKTLQNLINDLAIAMDAPEFAPHLTVVANILPNESEMREVREQCAALAARLEPFTITLTGYGYKDEIFRCLYVLAEAPELTNMYREAEVLFPQVRTEHFAALPHISVLYGNFDEAIKNGLIEAHPLEPLTFTVSSLQLYRTNNPVESWELAGVFPLAE